MEDYEKKYKDALAKAREIHRNEDEKRFDMEWLFPELADSNDERIRKALLEMVHDTTGDELWVDYNVHKEEALAWLEKQGNNTPIIIWHNIDEKPEEMKELFCEWESDDATWHDVAFYDEESHTFRHAKMPINVTKWVYVDELLEKQGEQKPVIDFKAKNWYVSKVDGKIHNIYYSVDKVEPKFKVRYAGGEYNVLEVKDIAGVTFYGIEDEPNHIDYVKAENCEIISGYAIKENGSPYPTKSAVFSEKKPTAWSEEDDYNLQCMIAKVTSDIQKGNVGRNNELIDWLKSLKDRVQPKQEWSEEDEECNGEDYGIDGLWHAQRILEKTLGSVDGYQSDDGILEHKAAITAVKKLCEKKTAWSDEDENYLQSAENACEYQYGKNTSTILWLKSLKDRIGG